MSEPVSPNLDPAGSVDGASCESIVHLDDEEIDPDDPHELAIDEKLDTFVRLVQRRAVAQLPPNPLPPGFVVDSRDHGDGTGVPQPRPR